MKLASYSANRRAAFGVVTNDGVITMNERLGGRAAGLKEALALNLIPQMAEAAATAKPDHRLADITFLPVIPHPELIACAGINRRNPPAWMKAGDVLELEITGIGTLRSRIVDEKA